MITTKILGDAIGIQSQGTTDKTETQTNAGLTNAVIVGQFMRGRFDQPMVIHQGNIRGQLGHDPLNPYYNAVQDCLDAGVPSVQVLRVGEINKSIPISCTGALNVTDWIDISGDWKLEVDGELVRPDATSIDDVIAYLTEAEFEVTLESDDDVPHIISFLVKAKRGEGGQIPLNNLFVTDLDTGMTASIDEIMESGALGLKLSYSQVAGSEPVDMPDVYISFVNPSSGLKNIQVYADPIDQDTVELIDLKVNSTSYYDHVARKFSATLSEFVEPRPFVAHVSAPDDVTLVVGGSFVDGPITINWGDGSPVEIETPTNVPFVVQKYHTYTSGDHLLTVKAQFGSVLVLTHPNNATSQDVTYSNAFDRIDSFGTWATTFSMLGYSSLVSVPEQLPKYGLVMLSGFMHCNNFNDPKISNWNTERVLSIGNMFRGATSFNQPLNWNSKNVVIAEGFLKDATTFNQDLSGWCVPLISSRPIDFSDMPTTKEPVWGTCPYEVPVISCDGAVYSSELLVDYLAEHSSNPIWHLEVYDQESGQLYSAITNNDLNLNSEYPDAMLPQALFDKRVNNDLDYGMNVNTHALSINNNTENNIRLKVIAYGHDELGRGIEVTGIEDINPTFAFFKNQPFEYDVRGCLSGIDGGGV